MPAMSESKRAAAREIADKHLRSGNPLDWFEELYAKAAGDYAIIPWADLKPNPSLVEWLNQPGSCPSGRAIIVGSGLGDDAEELARCGLKTTAFDISETAIAWSRRRFPESSVSYVVADLFSIPAEWRARFDLVLESYTLQVLPPYLRQKAVEHIASLLSADGILLVIARAKNPDEAGGTMAWPLSREDTLLFETKGLENISFEEFMDREDPPVRRFRAVYRRRR